jgi:CBS domain-containing protein
MEGRMIGQLPRCVGTLMTDTPATICPTERLDAADAMLALLEARHLPVVSNGKLVGILSVRDVLRAQLPEREFSAAAMAAHLHSLRVEEIMTRDPVVAAPTESVATAARTILSSSFSCLPIVREGELVGIVTTADLVTLALDHLRMHGEELGTIIPVGSLMTSRPTLVRPDDRLSVAELVMRFGHFHHLPVVEAEQLVGIVSDRDVLAALRPTPGEATVAERLLDKARITVRDIMTGNPDTMPSTASAIVAGQQMLERGYGALPVVSGSRLVGIITERDFVRYLLDRLTPGGEMGGQACPAKR